MGHHVTVEVDVRHTSAEFADCVLGERIFLNKTDSFGGRGEVEKMHDENKKLETEGTVFSIFSMCTHEKFLMPSRMGG